MKQAFFYNWSIKTVSSSFSNVFNPRLSCNACLSSFSTLHFIASAGKVWKKQILAPIFIIYKPISKFWSVGITYMFKNDASYLLHRSFELKKSNYKILKYEVRFHFNEFCFSISRIMRKKFGCFCCSLSLDCNSNLGYSIRETTSIKAENTAMWESRGYCSSDVFLELISLLGLNFK